MRGKEWQPAVAEANLFFEQLPERYRLNHHTKQLDFEIPDNDYSLGCFEGIRSEEIEPFWTGGSIQSMYTAGIASCGA